MLSANRWLAVSLLVAGAGAVRAQTADTRWTPWLGCWQTADAGAAIKCVVPTARASAVDVITLVNGQIDSRERIVADSQPHPIDRAGCRGTETATWSPNGYRLYRRAELTCAGTLTGTSTTLMAISPAGEWLNIEGMRAGAGSLERLDRYRDVGLPVTLPKEIRTTIAHQQLAIATARAAAAAPIGEGDVLEAGRYVDAGVVRSWVAVSGVGPSVAELASPPPRQPQVIVRETSAAASTCVAAWDGCYGPNPYSDYNGYVAYPYSPYPYYVPTPWYGYGSPLIIVRGTNRGRPPVIHGLRPPQGRPQGYTPHTPQGQTPRGPAGHPPMRPRP